MSSPFRMLARRMETFAAGLLLRGLGLLPFASASALGGWVARTVGPRLSLSRRALRHLALAFPDMAPGQRQRIIRGMWDNLGRTTAELSHLPRLRLGEDRRFRLHGFDIIDRLVAEGRQIVFVSAHIGNWELSHLSGTRHGLNVLVVHRAANTAGMDRLIQQLRVSRTVPKGAAGARDLMRHLRGGGHIGFLIDQKMNDGIPAPFFGHDAMTASAPAELALRYRAVLLPVRVTRHPGPCFDIDVEAPIEPDADSDRHAAVRKITAALNEVVERWVRDTPDQWFWLHRRWPATAFAPDTVEQGEDTPDHPARAGR